MQKQLLKAFKKLQFVESVKYDSNSGSKNRRDIKRFTAKLLRRLSKALIQE